ncbi:Similar to prunasin hydrolase precursor gb/U50201 from Prunus serotina. ESTs gb/T21225 and gb/AA586305 come from this gene [Arabidopsis thaliana]|nr:Similar to prunasin hydrolase precursor gb/U50201 from Prunus serotina. ESTs gb/T21225 and gb/AA586305 come from this gene [Arabidopsis thaliana]
MFDLCKWEGAAAEDGRKPSVWDTLCYSRNIGNGDVTCDGYHKYKEDVKLMVDTNLDAFRFSISWSRLIPNGRGSVNQKGLQFYKNLISELITHGIEPHVTLYHYDHPQYLEDEYGGWVNNMMIKDFTAYVDVCFREFGNYVKFWTTINEANVFTIGGYNDGDTPPGRCSLPGKNCLLGNSSTETYIVGHNLLLAHASASRLYKQKYKDKQGGSIGFGLYLMGLTPSTSSKDDAIATQRAKDFYFGWFLGPLIFGDYPDTMKRTIGSRLPVFSEEESEQFAASVTNIKFKPSISGNPDFYSDMGAYYPVAPWTMEAVLEYIKQSYDNPPVYILENGTPMTQHKDTHRVEYMNAYIGGVLKSIRNGSDTRGYFVWSFMDLFELIGRYDYGYGLYSVNFSDPHRKRSPRLSAHWYSDFLKGKTSFLDSKGIKELQSNFSSSS